MVSSRAKRENLIEKIKRFQLSGAYPVFFAILCTASGLGNKYVYLPIISILVISVLFSIFFHNDDRVFLTPMLMIYFSLGSDNAHAFIDSNADITAAFDSDGFVGICILAAIAIIPFIIRFIIKGAFAFALKNGGRLFWGIIALGVSTIFGGVFSKNLTLNSLIYGLIISLGAIVFFIIAYYIIKNSDKDIVPYICRIFVITCLVISAQVAVVALQAHAQQDLIIFSKYLDRWLIQRIHFYFSWGVPTIIGAMTVLGIPAAMYMAKNEKFPLLYYTSSIIFLMVSFVVNTRSAIVVGGIVFLVCAIAVCMFGKNKKSNLIFSLFLLSVTTALIVTALISVPSPKAALFELQKLLRFDSVSDRIELFKIGLKDFLSAPIFGVGWDKGALAIGLKPNNFFSNMYHCIIIQIAAASGIVGLITLLNHLKDILLVGFKKCRIDRLLILAVPVMIIGMSFVDNFFFYLNFQIPYMIFLALADKHLELTKK